MSEHNLDLLRQSAMAIATDNANAIIDRTLEYAAAMVEENQHGADYRSQRLLQGIAKRLRSRKLEG